MKKLGLVLAVILASAAMLWWSIGEDWRRLLSDPPSGRDVLFWEQGQRDTGFRMLDRIPFISKKRKIEAGVSTREFEIGQPIDFGFDIDEYFGQQRHSALVILHNGKLRHEQYGLGFTATGRWATFSVAKSITSTLVGAAIHDGHINSLDDPVTDYIVELEGSAYEAVTIGQLLTMTSGVRWNENYDDPASDVAQFTRHNSEGGESNLISYMKSLPREHPPGEVWNYSTGETNLIGILVSEATGKTLAEYLSQKIWGPLGMQQDANWLLNGDEVEISGCCIQAATRDLARYGQFMLEGAHIANNPIVPEGWVEAATSSQNGSRRAEGAGGYGYQWWTNDDGTYQAVGIFGQIIHIDPNRQLVIAANSSWTSALGDEEFEARGKFIRDVSGAIDEE